MATGKPIDLKHPGHPLDSADPALALRQRPVGDEAHADADHVEIIGELDNETGDEDKAPTLSHERHLR